MYNCDFKTPILNGYDFDFKNPILKGYNFDLKKQNNMKANQ